MILEVVVTETHIAVLTESKLFLEVLGMEDDPKAITFPTEKSEPRIKNISMNSSFLLMLNNDGKIILYSVIENSIACQFKPNFSIQRIFPNALMNKGVCLDKGGKAFLLNFVTESETEIIDFKPALNKVVWDMGNSNLFIGLSSDTAYTYIHDKMYYLGEK